MFINFTSHCPYSVIDMQKPYSLYILFCGNGSYYTGISSNISQRLESHQLIKEFSVKSKQWTSYHQPVNLVFTYEGLENYSVAVRVERYVKSLTKEHKRLLVEGHKPSYEFLVKKHVYYSKLYGRKSYVEETIEGTV